MNWRTKSGLYVGGQLLSLVGSSVVSFAMLWHVTLNTDSGMLISLVTLSAYLPQLITLPLGGILADRADAKKIIIISDSFIALVTAGLSFLFYKGKCSVSMMIVLNVLRSLAGGVEIPCVKNLLPNIVPQEKLMKVNSLFTGAWSASQLISPAISGILLRLFPLHHVFLVDVMTAAMGIGFLSCIPVEHKKQERPCECECRAGIALRYIASNKAVLRILILNGLVYFFTAPASQLTGLLASRHFCADVTFLSLTEVAFSCGAVMLSLVMTVREFPLSCRAQIRLAYGIFGVTMLLLILIPSRIAFLIVMLIMGTASPLFYTPAMTKLQKETDESYRGRVCAALDFLSTVMVPLGMVAAGLLSQVNVELPFAVYGLCLAALMVL